MLTEWDRALHMGHTPVGGLAVLGHASWVFGSSSSLWTKLFSRSALQLSFWGFLLCLYPALHSMFSFFKVYSVCEVFYTKYIPENEGMGSKFLETGHLNQKIRKSRGRESHQHESLLHKNIFTVSQKKSNQDQGSSRAYSYTMAILHKQVS